MNENIDFFGHDLIGQEKYDDISELRASARSTIDKLITLNDVKKFCSNSKKIECITLHHTWSPNSSQYNGRNTILGIKSYHMKNGFSDIAANFYTAPVDDYIGWTARPLSTTNGAHAYINKPFSSLPFGLRNRANGNKQYLNYKSVGIETIGNFDSENPKTSKSMRNSIKLMAMLCEIYKLDPNKDIFTHNMVEYKSCPGSKVDLNWIKSEVKKEMNGNNEEDCKDLPAKPYQEEALKFCVDNGILTGDSEGNLMSQCNLTRGDMAVMLFRFYNKFINK